MIVNKGVLNDAKEATRTTTPTTNQKKKQKHDNEQEQQTEYGRKKLKYVCVFIFNMQQCCFVSCNSIPCTYLCLYLDVAGSLLVQVCSTTLVDFCIGVCSCLLILSECECLHVIFMASPPPATPFVMATIVHQFIFCCINDERK